MLPKAFGLFISIIHSKKFCIWRPGGGLKNNFVSDEIDVERSQRFIQKLCFMQPWGCVGGLSITGFACVCCEGRETEQICVCVWACHAVTKA